MHGRERPLVCAGGNGDGAQGGERNDDVQNCQPARGELEQIE